MLWAMAYAGRNNIKKYLPCSRTDGSTNNTESLECNIMMYMVHIIGELVYISDSKSWYWTAVQLRAQRWLI